MPASSHSSVSAERFNFIRTQSPAGLRLPFPHGKYFVPVAHIMALSSERNYTRFHFRDGRTLLYSRTLGDLLSLLPTEAFARLHRSHAVNRHYIHTVFDDSVVLEDGSAWGVSRRKRGNNRSD